MARKRDGGAFEQDDPHCGDTCQSH